MKKEKIEFRCSRFEKKLFKKKAELAGLTLSEFCRKSVSEQKTIERLTDEQIEVYKMLVKYSNNFTAIGNMYRNRDPNLSKEVYKIAKQIKFHLQNFKK